MLHQPLPGARPDAWDGIQLRDLIAHLPAFAVIGDSKAMAFVANLLDQMQHGRATIQHDRLILLPVHVDDLFFLGDGGERLQRHANLFERRVGRAQLAEAAVDQGRAKGMASFRRAGRL